VCCYNYAVHVHSSVFVDLSVSGQVVSTCLSSNPLPNTV
jgi:hypothetical protein